MPNVVDIECYPDYFLAMLRNIDSGQTSYWEQYPGRVLDRHSLSSVLARDTLIGFNSGRYDLPILKIALAGAECKTLKLASDDIILNDIPPWQLADKYPMAQIALDHIDIMEPTPGVQVSLKSYAGRINAPWMQDLPIDPDAEVTPKQREMLRKYCGNDLDVTIRLYRKVEDRIELRKAMSEQYGIDLRSKSDAQIAEAVIAHECGVSGSDRPRIAPGTSYQFKAPGFINFQGDGLKRVLNLVQRSEYAVDKNGVVDIPKALADLKITVGGGVYRLGIGGLHSTEKRIAHHTDDDHVLSDHDVTSYYPNIILRLGLFPKHIGPRFLDVYRSIVDRRMAAKALMKVATKCGDKGEEKKQKTVQESLKIVLNGSFGKFGSKYSLLYSPDLLIRTTLTGQLALLQLIEQLEMLGIAVVSANTDGIVIKCPRDKTAERDAIIATWEFFSCFETEVTEYRALYSKDVNNYIAVKLDGGVKLKGLYAEPGLMKNPTNPICVEAVVQYLSMGVPVEETIAACDDITRFITIRSVKGGAVKGDLYLGKTVRWYYGAGETGAIHYRTNGNKVARSEGAVPLMTLPDSFPDNVDLSWYIAEAKSILGVIGA